MPDNKKEFQATKFKNEACVQVRDALTVEEALQIHINGKPFTITMRTPGSDEELVRGLLYSEDVYIKHQAIKIRRISLEPGELYSAVNVLINPADLNDAFFDRRSMLSVSSCGICGKKEIEDLHLNAQCLDDNISIEIQMIPLLFEKMQKAQTTFKSTGGSHAAAVFDCFGKLLAVKEDIGRHNAVDKAIGYLLIENQLDSASILLVSGRISYEIVSKVHKAGIPILAAVSAPSSFAVEYATRVGVSILGFCRNRTATCYSHGYRIKQKIVELS